MSKQYIVSEDRLRDLLMSEARLDCLEWDGVDNWEWYMEGRDRYIAACLDISEEEVEEKELEFDDVVEAALTEFSIYML